MKICKNLAVVIISSLLPLSVMARGTPVGWSDFFQDWTLNKSQSNNSCPSILWGRPANDIPGINGTPGAGYDSDTSVRFINKDNGDFEGLYSGRFVTLNENQIKVINKEKHLRETFTLLTDGGLIMVRNSRGTKTTCNFVNAHTDLVAKVQIGASLYIDGAKTAQCKFEPASPRPDQRNFVYNEKCSFGKYTKKQMIDNIGRELKLHVVQNPNATQDFEIIRSSKKLNAGSETYISIDDEIAVENSNVDDIYPNASEYFISPYENSIYSVQGTTAVVKLEYASQ